MMSRLSGLFLLFMGLAVPAGAQPPEIRWSFEGDVAATVTGQVNDSETSFGETLVGTAKIVDGVLLIPEGAGRVRVSDSGEGSLLDATNGDAITLEALFKANAGGFTNGQHQHLIGKGRTNNKAFAADNLNYALRITGQGNAGALSFVFRSAPDGEPGNGEYHRWTSNETLSGDGSWHHVALSYEFGKPESLQAFLDGEAIAGTWDMGGKTALPPAVDDDEVWIGSGAGGGAGSTFHGVIDDVVLRRRAATKDDVAAWRSMLLNDKRFGPAPVVAEKPPVPLTPAPSGTVLVEVFEGLPPTKSWKFRWPEATESYRQNSFGFTGLRRKYSAKGIQVDRSQAFGVRASSMVSLPEGDYEVILRARSGAKLWVDGEVIAETPFHNISGSGHGTLRDWRAIQESHLRPLQPGDHETLASLATDGSPREIRLELYVGGGRIRPEVGESGVFVRRKGEKDFHLVNFGEDVALTDAGMLDFHAWQKNELIRLDAERRAEVAGDEKAYWERRHEIARQIWREKPTEENGAKSIDAIVAARLKESGVEAPGLADDWAFVRRVTLDLIGTIPTEEQVDAFFADRSPNRRERYIDRLLEHPGWADHWVAYWQDALAENPNLVNPTQNNTGPFRWWLHESFVDNKPFDRIATELILMEGSTHYGGPGGFSLATQNDVPMAAKAHVLGQSLLAVDMSCARCHDSPVSDLKQADLFSFAAMLKRGPQDVPATSSVPPSDHARLVEVTLVPGTKVAPEWAFEEFSPASDVPSEFVRNAKDDRERVAAIVTSPRNERFVQVIVNRVWKRYLGRGLVEPVHNWQDQEPIAPELLDYLCREFVESGYDLKSLARMIVMSEAYGRTPVADPSSEVAGLLPVRRRMTAEQVVDSMFLATGKRFKSGEVNIDSDGARDYTSSMNLGRPVRAWEFVGVSNERDRPALALPKVQPFVTLMEAFGWQGARQATVPAREEDPTVLQSGQLANGVLSARFTRLSDDSVFTQMALEAATPEELLERTVARVLTRPATEAERTMLVGLLRDGFENRIINAKPLPFRDYATTGVSWSNHLHPEATRVQKELQDEVDAGDPPTERLQAEWRTRYEDVLWSLLNDPEFVFVP